MVISLVIYSSPVSGQGAHSAYNFCKAALVSGQKIHRLFFYEDGVSNSTTLSVMPQDENDLPAAWAELIRTHELDAVSCVASSLKRGMLDSTEASRYERSAANINPAFDVSGLGQWVDACLLSDRVVSFGG